jgi:hypothetical protein
MSPVTVYFEVDQNFYTSHLNVMKCPGFYFVNGIRRVGVFGNSA